MARNEYSFAVTLYLSVSEYSQEQAHEEAITAIQAMVDTGNKIVYVDSDHELEFLKEG